MPPFGTVDDTAVAGITLRGKLPVTNLVDGGVGRQFFVVTAGTFLGDGDLPVKTINPGIIKVQVEQGTQRGKLDGELTISRRKSEIIGALFKRQTIMNVIDSAPRLAPHRFDHMVIAIGPENQLVEIGRVRDLNHHVDGLVA